MQAYMEGCDYWEAVEEDYETSMGNTWTHLFIDGAVAIGDGSASTRGILDGLLVVLNKGFKRVTIQSDNLDVVKALQESWLTDSSITVLRRVRRILRTERQWYIRHVSRDLNHVIDCLANMSLVGKTDIQVFDGAPD
ncbi:hypothetical protein Goshw_027993 [Gossypium schwendimanii]|uniref:RNase H type-1 domain-containing protein n=1 Tax=Gossypium schwendimanii TaxID=34291 RepID=A0A7J9ND34_GOSSC|nr:hypothetical protein [Gossypium schwendimanii]